MDWLDWLRTIAALGVTLALIGLAALAARRFGALPAITGGGTRRLAVKERLALDPRRQLVIVQADGMEHVLLLSPFGDRRIATLAGAPSSPASGPPPDDAGAAP